MSRQCSNIWDSQPSSAIHICATRHVPSPLGLSFLICSAGAVKAPTWKSLVMGPQSVFLSSILMHAS